MDKFSYIANATPAYIEELYRDFQHDPASVDEDFKKFFEGFEFASTNFAEGELDGISADEFKVFRLIQAYRNRGHLIADTNPVRPRKDRAADLMLKSFGLEEKDLDRVFQVGKEINIGPAPLKAIIDHMEKCYCGSVGFEYNYIRQPEEKAWFRKKIEENPAFKQYDLNKKEHILRKLNEAVVFEKFLGTKYVGEKRFSLEGGETTMPALDAIVNQSANMGAEEVVIGMAHRGRLNVLANLMGKTYEEVFNEFEGNVTGQTMGDGDVKYHLGFSSMYKTTSDKEIYLQLAPNPSHLEAVDPVVSGYARAKIDVVYGQDESKVVPILIHGDAAVAGQGVVYELLQMQGLEGYRVGGTIHFVINNQIGFTTDFYDARTSDYCTSVACTTQTPVIHVNGDDIEAVIFAAEAAAEYRQKFKKDIFIDMVCYRKHGHNEADDPKYTQPQLYKLIAKHANPRDIYIEKLTTAGELEAALAKKMNEEFWGELQNRLDMVKQKALDYKPQESEELWKQLRKATPEDFDASMNTAVSKGCVKDVVNALIKVPEGFKPLRKINKYLENRRQIMQENQTVDWAAAELLAYGSLLHEGHNVRMSGQDVKRGTFSHRHAVIFDESNNEQYNRLSEVSKDQGEFMIHNSLLSEFGVLGFEYGYSLCTPDTLVIWEAQFGDFANNCQVMFDQFICSAESKWERYSGLVMLLPHGYEGQGPEHSSARLERFLSGCAEFNTYVTNITDPANFFHAMRRQLKTPYRKPLINMSPKSLLRHPECQSPISALMEGGFRELIDDDLVKDPKKVKRILFCTGKVYFDLLNYKRDNKRDDIAIVRLEQLYPLPLKAIERLMKERYQGAEMYWVQEEPMNMGAWPFILNRFYKQYQFTCISRKTKSSPATGFKKQHIAEQEDIVNRAFA